MRLLARFELAYAMLVGWFAVAAWRMSVAAAHDQDQYGAAPREHVGLLLLQGVLALLAGLTWVAVTVSARDRRPRQVAGCLAIFAVLVVAFAAIFLVPGLYDWGAFED
jgi:heme/copper-type cytochrome/quinol oxidase subunit 3